MWRRFGRVLTSRRLRRGLSSTSFSSTRGAITVSPPVQQALDQSKPVVCFETTILTHGLPYPENFQLAQECEKICREQNVEPATIGVVEGSVHVGMDVDALHSLCKQDSADLHKLSTRELPLAVAHGWSGGTTVASTAHIASTVGIDVFVTGGIGGVHRGHGAVLDISTDLHQLSQAELAVVCAGCKSILDIQNTLEVLESLGVVVGVYGSDIFPAFYSPTSEFAAPHRFDQPEEIARSFQAAKDLSLPSSHLIAVPVPEKDACWETDLWIQQALQEAQQQGVSGNNITPFVLSRVRDLSEETKASADRSGNTPLSANIALVYNNTRVGCSIASSIAQQRGLRASPMGSMPSQSKRGFHSRRLIDWGDSDALWGGEQRHTHTQDTHSNTHNDTHSNAHSDTRQRTDEHACAVAVVGSVGQDILATIRPTTHSTQQADGHSYTQTPLLGTSHPGTVTRCWGGVARNIAENAARLGASCRLFTVLGECELSHGFRAHADEVGLTTRAVSPVNEHLYRFPTYLAVLEDVGEQADLMVAVVDTDDFENAMQPHLLNPYIPELTQASVVVFDGNVPTHSITQTCQNLSDASAVVLFEPTSVPKTGRGWSAFKQGHIDVVTPSELELAEMARLASCEANASGDAAPKEEGQGSGLGELNAESVSSVVGALGVSEDDVRGALTVFQAMHGDAERHIVCTRGNLSTLVASYTPNSPCASAEQAQSDVDLQIGDRSHRFECKSTQYDSTVTLTSVPILPTSQNGNTSGCGDSLTGGIAAYLGGGVSETVSVVRGVPEMCHRKVVEAACFGTSVAHFTLFSEQSVHPELDVSQLLGNVE